jgi:hypothetical protein
MSSLWGCCRFAIVKVYKPLAVPVCWSLVSLADAVGIAYIGCSEGVITKSWCEVRLLSATA